MGEVFLRIASAQDTTKAAPGVLGRGYLTYLDREKNEDANGCGTLQNQDGRANQDDVRAGEPAFLPGAVRRDNLRLHWRWLEQLGVIG